MNGQNMVDPRRSHSRASCAWLLSLTLVLVLVAGQPIPSIASTGVQNGNHIILPADGRVVVTFVSTEAGCTGDFGLHTPRNILIFPDYLYYKGLSFPLPDYYRQNTELVFYIRPRGFCGSATFLSTDPNRARITHPDAYTWLIGWEDWQDADFNDLIVRVSLYSATIPFLDLPYDYRSSSFPYESRHTQQGGKVNAWFDHQYPTYCSLPNTGGCSLLDTGAVNFYGYDGAATTHRSPFRVLYNGHDGVDFSLPLGTPILAAASGTVSFVGGVSSVGVDGQIQTTNVIKVRHDNGYVTEYWHLSSFATGVVVGASVARDPARPIGYVGCAGCAEGPHLHFVARNPAGVVVDPYGWMLLPNAAWYGLADPWQRYNADHGNIEATSHYLWLHQVVTTTLLLQTQQTIIRSASGSATATVPTNAYNAALRLQMAEGLFSPIVPGQRGLYSFSLFGYPATNVPTVTLAASITLDVRLPPGVTAGSASKPLTPTLQLWDAQTSTWQKLSTTWNPATKNARATSSKIGTFALTVPEYRVYLPLVGKAAP